MIAWATRPPVHDSAVATVSPAAGRRLEPPASATSVGLARDRSVGSASDRPATRYWCWVWAGAAGGCEEPRLGDAALAERARATVPLSVK